MCRISGFWDFNSHNKYNLESVISRMKETLKHGGPDDSGVFCAPEIGLALGHRRLSILDLSFLGHQPMLSDNRKIIIVFNGEIYNFREIQKELQGFGFAFNSMSDTEVVIKAYQKWGIECLEKFRGMFAFALFDKEKEVLFLARDRLGVKPLYYYFKNNLLIFASELRAILEHPCFKKELNLIGLASFFKFGYIPYPFSIWQNIYKLEPGSFLSIGKKTDLKKEQYWSLENCYLSKEGLGDVSPDGLQSQLEEILFESFKLRMVSDVPVGVFLSGGIDSSIVASILQKNSSQALHTFTIGFEDKEFNEAGFAKKIAQYLGTNHTEMFCSEKDALEIVPLLPEIYDEPFGDSSAVPTFLISKLARKEVKVVLSGDGGDEFFGGYDKYWKLANHFIFKTNLRLPQKAGNLTLAGLKREGFYKLAKKIHILQSKDNFEKFGNVASCVLDNQISDLLPGLNKNEFLENVYKNMGFKKEFLSLDIVSLWMFFDAKFYLAEDILTKVDRASMHNALESREPLLDHKIIEFMGKLPSSFKVNKTGGKLLLKKVLEKYLPKDLWSRPKQGFSVPMKKWLSQDLKPLVEDYLSVQEMKKYGVLNPNYVSDFKIYFYNNQSVNPYKLWYLLVFQMWAEKWL